MAQVSFDQLNFGNSKPKQGNGPMVGFFSLKDNNDEAIVRIMHDSTADFDILTTHPVSIDGKMRKVNCLRTPTEPMNKCPLCASGAQVQQRLFIHVVVYTVENGQIKAEPKVWERSMTYANTLKSYIDNYGPMSDVLCKIIRHGVKGDPRTTYEIIPNINLNPEMYPKRADLFEGYKVLGTVVMDKSFDDVSAFVATGRFPAKQQATPNPGYQAPVEPQAPVQQTYNPAPAPFSPAAAPAGTAPWEMPNGNVQKPVRYYE